MGSLRNHPKKLILLVKLFFAVIAIFVFFLPFSCGSEDDESDTSGGVPNGPGDGDEDDGNGSGMDDDGTQNPNSPYPSTEVIFDRNFFDPYNPDPGNPEGNFWAIDYAFTGETLVVLYSDAEGTNSGIGEFERSGDSWQLINWLQGNRVPGGLNFPHTIELTDRGYLISDAKNNRAIEIGKLGNLLFEYSAVYANEVLETEEGLIVSWTDMRGQDGCGVDIVDWSGNLLWRYDSGLDLDEPAEQMHHGNVLPNGNILMAISPSMGGMGGNGLILEVDRNKKEVWRFQHESLFWPRNALRLKNGNTLIGHMYGIWEVEPDGDIVWKFDSTQEKFEGETAVFNILRLDDGTTVTSVLGAILWIAPNGQIVERFAFGEE